MNNFSVRLFTLAALVCGVFFLTNCSSTPTTSGNNSAVVTNTNKAASTPVVAATTPAEAPKTESADKIGVAECDEYITKWEACVNSKVPEAQRSMYKTSFDTTRKSWKDLAANPQTKGSLTNACKQALDQAKTNFASFKCEW
jgi:hypothetical protein